MRRIIEAIVLCAEQGLPLRGHREKDAYPDERFVRPANRGNFIAIIEAFAKYDEILNEHLLHGARNATYLSPQIQNEIIGCIAHFIRCRTLSTKNFGGF